MGASPIVHYTALHYIAQHYVHLLCIALHCTVNCTALCTALCIKHLHHSGAPHDTCVLEQPAYSAGTAWHEHNKR